ncbi:hypothetical protein KPH14_007505 [Odynerus spinipes]|uniref:Uncharacterized protein n=1 Tax=Odynerus spinipes TaxID=1348599 RepID=A0AAD9RHK9_9HYME|nr:hypothetical protein KPH14_007505 [Odynerus spinipes]
MVDGLSSEVMDVFADPGERKEARKILLSKNEVEVHDYELWFGVGVTIDDWNHHATLFSQKQHPKRTSELSTNNLELLERSLEFGSTMIPSPLSASHRGNYGNDEVPAVI